MSSPDPFAGMDDTLFDAFGVDATVQRGAGAPVPVRVVITRGVQRLGEYGQVVARVTVVDVRNSQWQLRTGDVIDVEGRQRTVDDIDQDDGYVTTGVLHG